MPRLASVCLLLLLTSTLGVSPAPSASAYHDQRQSGAFNIHTQLENFIVVLIPTSSLSSSSWLNFAKRLSLQDHLKHVREDKPKSPAPREEDVAAPMILDKAPYTVDVEIKPKASPLSRLHPAPVLDISSDVMVALSPSVALSRSGGDAGARPLPPPAPEKADDPLPPPAPESADDPLPHPAPERANKPPRAPEVATEAALRPPEVRPLQEPTRMAKRPKSILSTTLERVGKTPDKDLRLRLLGAGIEICASNERRGEDGNCEPIKARRRSGQFFLSSGLLPSLQFGLSPANEK